MLTIYTSLGNVSVEYQEDLSVSFYRDLLQKGLDELGIKHLAVVAGK